MNVVNFRSHYLIVERSRGAIVANRQLPFNLLKLARNLTEIISFSNIDSYWYIHEHLPVRIATDTSSTTPCTRNLSLQLGYVQILTQMDT